jgi:hypothetical protein
MARFSGGSGDTADFVFTEIDEYQSSISLPGDKGLKIEAGVDSDLNLTAGDDIYIETLEEGDDIHLNAADDIRFSTANDLNENPTTHYWRMDSEGKFQLPGAGYIENPIDSSGDGSAYDTLKLVPDVDVLYDNNQDQYLIIDPTTPNHIHIRAGGVQDASTANLFLGAERTGIEVSDTTGDVIIRSKNSDQVNIYANSNGTSNTEFIHATGADIVVGDTVRLYTGGDIFTVTSVTELEGSITVVAEGLTFIPGESYNFYRNMGENNWVFTDNGSIEFPNNSSNARTGNGEVLQFGEITTQSIITGPPTTSSYSTATRLVVAGQDGYTGTSGEGGDVYLWAGRGGSEGGSGGDIKLDAGNGGSTSGAGGTVKMRGGYSSDGIGGFVEIIGGSGYVAGGAITLISYNTAPITLSGDGGEFLNNSTIPDNQIATLGDLPVGISFVSVPGTNTSTGTVGQIANDTNHLYVCVATNSWVRINKDNW